MAPGGACNCVRDFSYKIKPAKIATRGSTCRVYTGKKVLVYFCDNNGNEDKKNFMLETNLKAEYCLSKVLLCKCTSYFFCVSRKIKAKA